MPEVMLIDVKMFADQAVYEKAMELVLPQRRKIIARLKKSYGGSTISGSRRSALHCFIPIWYFGKSHRNRNTSSRKTLYPR